MSAEGGTRAVLAALVANLAIAGSKFVAFAFTGSASMLAEGVHSVADSGNQVLLLYGSRAGRRPADTAHPFGYGRDRYFYAFVVALVLFSVGGLFAIYEGISKLSEPHPLSDAGIAIGVLIVAIGLESASFRTAYRIAARQRGGLSWVDYVRHAKAPELPVVLLEDTAALVGLVLALLGVLLALATGDPVWDAVGSLAIGGLLIAVAAILAVEMKSLLIGESATTTVTATIERELLAGPEIARMVHLRTLHLGPEELLVAAKCVFDPGLDLPALAAAIDRVEHRVRTAVPLRTMIYLEPDVWQESGVGPQPAEQHDVSPPARPELRGP